jgi:hypothetical protein
MYSQGICVETDTDTGTLGCCCASNGSDSECRSGFDSDQCNSEYELAFTIDCSSYGCSFGWTSGEC